MKSNILKAMAILSFIISAIFSVTNMYSSAFSWWTGLVCAVMAIILEYFKVYSIYKAISDVTLTSIVRVVCVGVYIVLLCFSIGFSMAFISNEENANKNYEAKHSLEAQKQNEKIATDNESVKRLNGQIASIQSEYKSIIEQKQNYASTLPDDYITAKNNVLLEIEQLKKEMTNKIEKVNVEITSIEKSKKETLTKKVNVEASTTGFTSILSTITTMHNATEKGKENLWTLEQVTFYFYLILAIVFELVASLLYYFSEHEKGKSLLQADVKEAYINKTIDNAKVNTKNVVVAEAPTHKIGFSIEKNSSNDKLDKSIIARYKAYAINNSVKSNGKKISPGYKSIAKAINVDQETCRMIKKYLEENGEFRTEGTRTIIL